MRVLPVTNSAPEIASIGYSATWEISPFSLQEIEPVNNPFSRALFNPPITYGVLPDAAIPTSVSNSFTSYTNKSCQACSISSSAFSTAFLMAPSPPAINPTTISKGTPKVGGHSEASTTPKRPLVPAPI